MSVLVLLLALASVGAHASTITYNFTYDGTGTFNGRTDTGSGSLTYSYNAGNVLGTLTAFSFSDTLHSASSSSTFTYGLADVNSSAITLLPSGYFATLSLLTDYKTGTNSSFGPVDFALDGIVSTGVGSTSSSNVFASNFLSSISSGTVTLAPAAVAVTPEPGTLSLLGMGLLGAAPMLRRKLAGQKA